VNVLVPVWKRHFFTISPSGDGVACAKFGKYKQRNPWTSQNLSKICSFPPREPRGPHRDLPDGNVLGFPGCVMQGDTDALIFPGGGFFLITIDTEENRDDRNEW